MSLHDPLVGERFPDLTHEQLMEQMYVVDRAGRRHGGAGAIRYLSRRLPRLWVAPEDEVGLTGSLAAGRAREFGTNEKITDAVEVNVAGGTD